MHPETVLKLLRDELAFLDHGGYRRSPYSPWRSARIFEESPSCPNFGVSTHHHRCIDCWLLNYIDPNLHHERVPCRFVQIMANGLTAESLHRLGTPSEVEANLRAWLRKRMRDVEQDLVRLRPLFRPERTLLP